ncbi:LOW QUALITY PROTEIN: hypothetical protein CFOL_v3_34687, partial [Cephalotus follicularis]
MKAVLLRTGSATFQQPVLTGSPKLSISRQHSFTGIFSGERNAVSSPRISLHLEPNRRIRRVSSEGDVIRSGSDAWKKLSGAGSRSVPARIPEEAADDRESLILKEKGVNLAGTRPIGFPGNFADFGGANGNKSKIGDYYKKMLESNPGDSLLLRNYGKYLHEVEKDTDRAEEYGRAILASPGDGELLSLYGKFIWETQRDESRAKSYFDQSVYASPNDCMVLASYADFMWQTDKDKENEEINDKIEASPAM